MRTEKAWLYSREIMSKETYKKLKSQGICVRCGKNNSAQGRVTCLECAEKQRIYKRDTREFLRGMDLCPRCGMSKLFGDEKCCPECSAKIYESNRKNREKRRTAAADYYKKEVERLKKQGICRSCRKRKVADGRTYCQICLAKKKEQSKEYRRKKHGIYLDRGERPNYGLCYFCGSPLDRDGRTCKKCAESVTKNFSGHLGKMVWQRDNDFVFRRKEG